MPFKAFGDLATWMLCNTGLGLTQSICKEPHHSPQTPESSNVVSRIAQVRVWDMWISTAVQILETCGLVRSPVLCGGLDNEILNIQKAWYTYSSDPVHLGLSLLKISEILGNEMPFQADPVINPQENNPLGRLRTTAKG
ncbi:hypothetical protein BU17DRAFT_63368 [Hysterangium stoloniferum]|nr:hypothetical protein BU17DRAFT_63368 [Hysterangium stoloniferum]